MYIVHSLMVIITSKNEKFCMCLILVDSTPPTVSNCPTGVDLLVSNLGDTVVATWTEPTVVDNSGLAVTTIQSHQPGDTFSIGFTAVTYVFRDSVNNINICSFVVSVGCEFDRK